FHKAGQEVALPYHPGAGLVFADGTPDILAYPRDRAAWGRLCRLLTRGNLRAEKGECILYRDDLLEHIDGLELIVMEKSTWEHRSPPFLWKRPPGSLPRLHQSRTCAKGRPSAGRKCREENKRSSRSPARSGRRAARRYNILS